MLKRILLASSLLSLAPAVVRADAQVGHAFNLSNLQCQNFQCETADGSQPGLTTVEVSGHFPDVAGMSVDFLVARKTASGWRFVIKRHVGVMSDGSFTTSIPAYNFADGTYTFVAATRSQHAQLGVGRFTKSSNAGRGSVQPLNGASGSALTGTWIGINGTAGRIDISPDGTYAFNGTSGRYSVSGDSVIFTGPLSAWNGGRGKFHDNIIEFSWTNAEGASQYFVFEKT